MPEVSAAGGQGGRCCAQVWHMDRPGEMMVLPLEAELPPNAVVRVNRTGSLVRSAYMSFLLWCPDTLHHILFPRAVEVC